MLTHRVPCPPDRGDRIRAHHLLKAIASRCHVTLASIVDEPMGEAARGTLSRLADRVVLARVRPRRQRVHAARALLLGRAITPAAMHDPALCRRLIDLHQQQPFDTVLTYCTGMIGYTRALQQAPGTRPFRHVLDLVDVDSLKWAGYAKRTRGPMRLVYAAEARRLRAAEAGRTAPFDAVTVISDNEADRYRESVNADITPHVVANGVDLERFYPAQQGATPGPVLTFTGVMSYKPNIDAAAWFARRVMPRVLAAVPGARFDIVGKSPTDAVQALGELPGVRVVGPVDEPADYLRGSACAVAPIAIAPGVQNKVLEAMACGLGVVCTSQAAAGIDATPGRHLLVADNEADFAGHCVRLLLHPGYRAELGRDARARIAERYGWAAAAAPMLDLLTPAAASATVSIK